MAMANDICIFSDRDGEDFGDTANNCTSPFEYTRTNIWSSSFSAPEINCDIEILHSDLQEIKALVSEIRDCIKNFFSEN